MAGAMRRLRTGITPLVVASALAAAWLVPEASADSASDVRTAILAAAAYAEDHGGSYAGMTVAGLRRWVNVKNVTVVRATRRAYCIQSIRGRRIHFDGPNGQVRYGPCGVRGAIVPEARPPAPKPQPAGDAATAQRRLLNASAAALAYYTDHGSYKGMTLAKLQSYDKAIVGIIVAWARPTSFCIQSGGGSSRYHLRSADFRPTRGRCPGSPP
jgi:hypothetical protein